VNPMTDLPKHEAREALLDDVLRFHLDDVRRVVADELLLRSVVRVARDVRRVLVDDSPLKSYS
jgi:hypothetical protein